MNFMRVLASSCGIAVVACGGPTGQGDGGSTGETADTETTDSGPPMCGDGVVNGFEECEPGGPVDCADDCTLASDGPGTIEWVFLDEGAAMAIAVDSEGRALVGGCRPSECANPWLARLHPEGTPIWELVDSNAGGSIADVTMDDQGRAIVVGRAFQGGTYADAWIAAYLLGDGTESWSVTQPSGQGYGSSGTAVAVLGDAIHVAIDSPTGGIEHEPSMTIFNFGGVAGATRTWAIGYDSVVDAIAVDQSAMQLVQVGSWNTGNWIEALDVDDQTLWTANEAIERGSGDGFARVQDVAIDAAGFVYVVGEGNYNDGQNGWTTAYVRRLSGEGQADWTVTSLPVYGEHAIAVADDVVYVVGSQVSVGMWLVAYSAADGELIWQRQIPREPDGPDGIHDLAAGPGSLWVAGFRWGVAETMNSYVARVTR